MKKILKRVAWLLLIPAIALAYTINGTLTVTKGLNVDSGTLTEDSTNHRVGVGTPSPGYLFHVFDGSSGASASAGVNKVFETSSTQNFLTFLSPNTAISGMIFGDPESNVAGSVTYNHATDSLVLSTAENNPSLTLTSSALTLNDTSLFQSNQASPFTFYALGDGYGGGTSIVRFLCDAPSGAAYYFWQAIADFNGAPSVVASLDSSGNLAGVKIDASQTVSGTFADARIPNLDASKITSGTFADARIPNLDASKITSGTFANARISQSSVTQYQSALFFVKTGSYVGNGAPPKHITGLGFKPYIVLINRETTSGGANNSFSIHQYGENESSTAIVHSFFFQVASYGGATQYVSMDADGFSILQEGPGTSLNQNGFTYWYTAVGSL